MDLDPTPRTKLHRPTEPSHNFSSRQTLCHPVIEINVVQKFGSGTDIGHRRPNLIVRKPRPKRADRIESVESTEREIPSFLMRPRARAQPIAPPASPAAGCTQIESKIFSFRMAALATQLRATPPSETKCSLPRPLKSGSGQPDHHDFKHLLDGCRQISSLFVNSASGARGRPSKRSANFFSESFSMDRKSKYFCSVEKNHPL